jgi:hypothetical protein
MATRPPAHPDQLGTRLRRDIAAAHAAMDSAMRAADTARLSAIIDSTAEIVTANGRAIRGSADVARALLGDELPPARYRPLFPAGEQEFCLDGGLETGRYAISRVDDSSAVNIESGAYTIRWITDEEGVRIGRVGLGESQAASAHRAGSCQLLAPVAFRTRRLEITAGPSLVAPATARALEHDLSGKGWTRSAAQATRTSVPSSSWTHGDQLLGDGGRDDNVTLGLLGAAVRLTPTLLVQASTQLNSMSGALVTFNPSNSSRLLQRFTLREVAAAEMLVEWRSLRFGAGPVLVKSDWREQYDMVVLQNGSYVTDYNTIADGHWNKATPGLVGEVAYVRPFNSSFHTAFAARVRAGPPIRLTGVPTHENWSATMTDAQIGLRVGLAW